jgi:hypothetical protein
MPQNVLFVTVSHLHTALLFVSFGYKYMTRLMVIDTTLAYYSTEIIMTVNSFMIPAPNCTTKVFANVSYLLTNLLFISFAQNT